jgi:hypothetical protein
MSVLIINDDVRAGLRAARDRARAKPLSFAMVQSLITPNQDTNTLKLEDRGEADKRPASEHVMIPIGYHVAISYEDQPAGLCLHVSVSKEDRPGLLPHPHAFSEIIAALDIDMTKPPGRVWLEEYLVDGKPGGQAVNVLFLVLPREGGNA